LSLLSLDDASLDVVVVDNEGKSLFSSSKESTFLLFVDVFVEN